MKIVVPFAIILQVDHLQLIINKRREAEPPSRVGQYLNYTEDEKNARSDLSESEEEEEEEEVEEEEVKVTEEELKESNSEEEDESEQELMREVEIIARKCLHTKPYGINCDEF